MKQKVNYKEIGEKVNNFKTKYKEGFLESEIKELLKDYPNISMDKFNDALRGVTCHLTEEGIAIYPCDIEVALRCGLENRGLRQSEFD